MMAPLLTLLAGAFLLVAAILAVPGASDRKFGLHKSILPHDLGAAHIPVPPQTAPSATGRVQLAPWVAADGTVIRQVLR